MKEKEKFERDVKILKSSIESGNISDCEEILEIEFYKDKQGNYKNTMTAQFYQLYLMGIHEGVTSTLTDILVKDVTESIENVNLNMENLNARKNH